MLKMDTEFARLAWARDRAADHGSFVDYYTRHHQGKKVDNPDDPLLEFNRRWDDEHAYIQAREAAHYANIVLNSETWNG
jgi:hypothetical protein